MNPLEKATLGTSTVPVTRLGLGTAPLGGWPEALSEEQGTDTVNSAWDLGLKYFDTAPFYGYGQSERWLGKVLARQPRSSFTISTKMGRLLVDTEESPEFYKGNHHKTAVSDFSYDGAMRSLEESLRRLGLDHVDVGLIHDPDDALDDALEGTYRALKELRDEGVIGAIGAGMNFNEPLVYLAERAELDCVSSGRQVHDFGANGPRLSSSPRHGEPVLDHRRRCVQQRCDGRPVGRCHLRLPPGT